MKKNIFFICALFLVSTGFNQQERFVEQSNMEIPGRVSAVDQKPKITQGLMSVSVNEGGIATFLAAFEPADDRYIKIEWSRNGESLPADVRFKTYVKDGYATLVINRVTVKDAGVYRIKIHNDSGSAESQGTLTVRERN